MSEIKHTPGPWEVENCGVGKQANKLFIWPGRETGVDFHAVATVHEDFGNRWANARLISAAPDLLKSCKDLLFFCENMDPKDTMREIWEGARASIAKAEGSRD